MIRALVKSVLFYCLFLLAMPGLFSACVQNDPTINVPASPPPVKAIHQPRVALVLGCGGARGYAHLGVLQALEEAHIPVDVIVGASAGSVVAAIYADNQNFLNTYNIMMPAGTWDFADINNFPGYSGIIKGDQLESFLMQNIQAKNFNELKTPLIVATTDINSGKTYVIESGPIAPAILASAAVPGVIKPVHLYGHWLVDGGVADPVPVDLAKQLHPKIIIAVNLVNLSSNAMPASAYGQYELSYDIMWQRLTSLSLQGADVVISPKVGDVGTFDLSKKHDMYLAGLQAGRQAIPRIRNALEKIAKQ